MIGPYLDGYLKVSDIHSIYYSCWGNRNGKTIMLLHGGPGYGCDIEMLNDLDLSKWNVIMHDQRGCGKSLPLGELEENTTTELVEDVKKLLDYLGINRAVIKGASWGTTLAMIFAQKYPSYVSSMVLIGYFNGGNEGTLLGRYGGFEKYYPDLYSDYLSCLTEEEQKNPYKAYCNYILNDENKGYQFAENLVKLESLVETTYPDYSYARSVCDSVNVHSVAKIETFYTMNDFFLEKDWILNQYSLLKDIKISIIHGRMDIITPVFFAWQISQQLELCDLYIIEKCGHDIDTEEGKKVLKRVLDEHYQY